MTKESLNSSRTPSDGHLADTNPNSAQTLAASCSQPVLTLSQGAPVSDTASSQTLGQNGPVLLQDVDFIEKLAHFDRERIPERVVHAKGSGAFGTFRPYRSMRDYTSAAFLQDPSVSTRFLIRFSTVIGSKGSPDTDRDPRGFAVKFYTSQGNYDVVGLSLPVFFIRDAMQFPDFIHSQKPDPCTNIKNYAHVWDFFSLTPESLHQLMWLYSDRGIVKDFAKMDGFGVNTFVWVNEKGERFYVKYRFAAQEPFDIIDRKEGKRLAGQDPDIAVRTLHRRLALGNPIRYEFQVQIMKPEMADQLSFDPLDDTKIPKTFLPTSSRQRSVPQTSFPASNFPPIKCCRDAHFPTPTHSVTASAQTSPSFRSTARFLLSPTTSRTAIWHTKIRPAASTTNQTP